MLRRTFAAAVAGGYGLALLIPAARAMLAGPAAGSWPAVLWSMAVVIPLGTVLPEEFAFRGALWEWSGGGPVPGWRPWSPRGCSASGPSPPLSGAVPRTPP